MRTSADGVYAIGQITPYINFIYGLIFPGYDMAGVCVKTVAAYELRTDLGLNDAAAFTCADLSTKLKLLRCDVTSFSEN